MLHDARRLERLFRDCFFADFRTVLEGGGAEPLYVPSRMPERAPHRVVYREDFFASALHEIAHWCIAGGARRELEDYGYWYVPDGRNEKQQADFEQVEARPQAIEWILSEACGFEFNLSADNLGGDNPGGGPGGGLDPSESFAGAVREERRRYLEQGMPARARRFREALAAPPGAP